MWKPVISTDFLVLPLVGSLLPGEAGGAGPSGAGRGGAPGAGVTPVGDREGPHTLGAPG